MMKTKNGTVALLALLLVVAKKGASHNSLAES